MRAIVFFCCVSAVFALEGAEYAQRIAQHFLVTQEEAQKCIDETHATYEEVDLLRRWLFDPANVTISKDTRNRASCLLACAMQANKMMSGTKITMDKYLEHLELPVEITQEEKEEVKRFGRICIPKSEGPDACEVAINFTRCMFLENMRARAQKEYAATTPTT